MKVLMFGWEFPPYVTGGLGTHCYNLTKALSARNVGITFVMPSAGKATVHPFLKVVNAGDMKVIHVDANIAPYEPSCEAGYSLDESKATDLYGTDMRSRVTKYTRLALKAAQNEDFGIIHCHDWMTFPAGSEMKKKSGKPLLVTVHSIEHDRNPISPNQWITDIEWKGMYDADRVIAVSSYMKDRIVQNYGVPPEKIDVIHNAVEASEYGGGRIMFGGGEKIVLFLGRLAMQKGPDYFLRSARKVLEKEKDVRFVVVGTGGMLPQLIDQSISEGIADKVTFAGYQESISEYYRMADIYVMPSVSEPFGITALEAMASGTPVLISKQSGVSEVLHHCMKVDFWDTDEMANKIIGMLKYNVMRDEMRTNGTREIDGISWGKIADRTRDLYSRMVGG